LVSLSLGPLGVEYLDMQSHLLNLFVRSKFVLPREDAEARHITQAIGSSSLQKEKDFVARYIPNTSPTMYGNYEEVYSGPEVDVVYIGTLTGSTRRIVWMPPLLARMCFARRLSPLP
jgi:predicted dehydrogenase